MASPKFSDLRLKLILLILVALLPVIGLVSYNSLRERDINLQKARNEALRIASLTSGNQEPLISSTGQLLVALAKSQEVLSGKTEPCSSFMAELVEKFKTFTNIGAADLSGTLYCSGIPTTGPVTIADRTYFINAVANKDLSLGEYQIGRVTGKATIGLGYPVLNDSGSLVGVVFAAIDLGFVNTLAAEARLPQGAVFNLIDQNGIVLARYPDPADFIGKPYQNQTVLSEVIGKTEEGSLEAVGSDGVARLYAYKPLIRSQSFSNAYIIVGFSKAEIFADSDRLLGISILVLFIAGSLALALAWVVGNRLIVRDVEKQRELDRAKEEFFSVATHELRTPLTAMRGNAALMMQYLGDKTKSADLREMAADIHTVSERLIKIVGDYLNMLRLEQNRLEFKFEDAGVEQLIEEALKEVEVAAKEKGLEVKFEKTNAQLPTVRADPDRLKQVLINLIGNAIKFTEKGSITVEAGPQDKFVKVSVADTGLGMPPERQSQLFQKFRQVGDKKSGAMGSGLGLYISRLMIEGMGGKIWLERSEVGQGSTFCLTLPKADKMQG